jgi:hypothetical protein
LVSVGYFSIFDCVIIYPKVAFVFAVDDLLDSYFVVDVEAIENLKEKWYSNAHVTGSDMRAWIHDNADIDLKQRRRDPEDRHVG